MPGTDDRLKTTPVKGEGGRRVDVAGRQHRVLGSRETHGRSPTGGVG